MIRTFAITKNFNLLNDIPLEKLTNTNINWFWVDFDCPTEDEFTLLSTHFNFHPLAIEDCLHVLQRPKLDYYDGYDFFVLHTMNHESITPNELDIFVGKNFIVTTHFSPSYEVDIVRQKLLSDDSLLHKGSQHILYLLMDKVVDEYFPSIYDLEDTISEIEMTKANQDLMQSVFGIRSQLLKLRRIVFPMRELLYRVLNSDRVVITKEERIYFMDIYDHLLRLSEMIESNREMTNDIRDSYISINSDRMNSIMKTLTVMTSVFIPLTFIASIYGMNFNYMPELTWSWGYYGVLAVMLFVGLTLLTLLWFKGWFK